MKKILLLLAILAVFVSGCDFKPSEITEFENSEYVDESLYVDESFIDSLGPKVDHEFIFADGDTIVGDYAYIKYIPFDSVKPDDNVVTAQYVRYHNGDIGLAFKRDYIYDLCMHSRCIYREVFDTINGCQISIHGLDTIKTYSTVKEYFFPEAWLGFAYDIYGEMPVYSYIYFDTKFWYSSIADDDITVTSDVENVLWNLYYYITDSVKASVNIYRYDEQLGVELDHVKTLSIQVWDIIRCFHNNEMDGLQKDDIIVYTSDNLIFVRPIGSDMDHLKTVYFSGYTIDNPSSLEKLESYFMPELDKIPVRDDDFIEPYEEP